MIIFHVKPFFTSAQGPTVKGSGTGNGIISEKPWAICKKICDKIKMFREHGFFKKKHPWVINKNIIPKKELYNLIYHSKCLCVPLKFGSGTRIKIIEALSIGAIVISSLKGIEGIELNKKNPPFILKNNKKLINTINHVIKNNKFIKKKSINAKKFYLKKYSMREITNNFLKNCL